ncbi:MAG: tetratricopeptide repeat protein [Cyanobacteriota/Melainabacteria group bacterium]
MKEVNILIAKDPLEGRYYHSRGEMLFEMGQLPAALESLRKSRELGCSYRCIYDNLFCDARMHNNYREVIALCDEYIERNSADSYSLTARGDAFERLGDKARATEDFKAVVALRPESADQYWDLSDALDHLGRKQEALAAIDEAIRRQPAEVRYRCKRSKLLIALGRYRDAISETDTLLKKDPECVGGLCNAGVAMYKLGLTRMALANLNKSIGIYPLDTALYYRSKIHESMGDFRAAELDRAKYKSMGFDP